MKPAVFSAFVKHALSMGTLRSFLGARAAQGVGGAEALGKSLVGSTAQTSRQAVKGMSGLQKHRLQGVVQGGKDVRQMERLPGQVGLGETAKATRERVTQAVRQEAANPAAARAGGVPLSKGYEGYHNVTHSGLSYNPKHVEQVMGLKPGQYMPRQGPTGLGRRLGSQPGAESIEATAPAISGVRKKRVDPHATTVSSGATAISRPRRARG